MSNSWFRMYAEFATDPKVQMLPETMQRRLIMLFCIRCNGDTKNTSDAEIAFSLRIAEAEAIETKNIFIQKGFIDDSWKIIKWEERQFLSDDSKERVKKHRQFKKSMGLTANGYTKHTVTVTQRDNEKCVYCESTKNLCLDHILPVCQGGNDDIENLALACKECNSGKAGRTPSQAGYSFKNKQREIEWNTWMNNHVTVTVTPPDTEQITDTEKKVSKSSKGSRFALADLPDDWRAFSREKRPELDPDELFAEFKDFWAGVPGQRGRKLDWLATWRNRVRDKKSTNGGTNAKPNFTTTGQRLAAKYRQDAASDGESATGGVTEPVLCLAEAVRKDAC